ncbi:MAG: substrate-binding domain-containing protein [Methanofollis liminatans]|jgi:phosphate transport system substrate-binding protein|uniref:Phosphate-binding protein n=1 Tax=Methanofollis liminatans DSM 4140 TaxID=28892 RepID=J0S1L2_9EURY|nr:substrate-binding domain-containing protein [Methanofollis liminatans]EJG07776.1 phosphate-binding protein [Methanofollis liminatans DSM 4140]MDD3111079.1 substrate-binding domain-containing protein [Methanofollis liminatans]
MHPYGKDGISLSHNQYIGVVALLLITAIVALVFLFPPLFSGTSAGTPLPANLTIAGSTTIQPISEFLAADFMAHHPDVRVVVEGGGSGAGIARTVDGTAEIGAASRSLEAAEREQYPNLVVHPIGGSGVVLIAGSGYPSDEISCDEAALLYNTVSEDLTAMPHLSEVRAVIQRSDSSGTEEIFAQWLYGTAAKNLDASLPTADTGKYGTIQQIEAEGSAGVLKAVADNPGAIGFVDVGYAEGAAQVHLLRVIDRGSDLALPSPGTSFREAILGELAHRDDEEQTYIQALTRPLNYLTNGTPTGAQAAFIQFATSKEAERYFKDVGYFSIREIRDAMGIGA